MTRVEHIRRWCRELYRWVREPLRCDHCARRRHWMESWIGDGSGKRVWHDVCHGYLHFRRVADERIFVLDIMADLSGLTMNDITTVAEGRASTEPTRARTNDEANAWDKAWRVMYDLDKYRGARR